jgi:hypothetical protein
MLTRFTKPLLYQLSYAGPHVGAHNLHRFFLSLEGFLPIDRRESGLPTPNALADRPAVRTE